MALLSECFFKYSNYNDFLITSTSQAREVGGQGGSIPQGFFQPLLNHLSPPDNWTNYALNATRLMLATYILNEANIFYSAFNLKGITVLLKVT